MPGSLWLIKEEEEDILGSLKRQVRGRVARPKPISYFILILIVKVGTAVQIFSATALIMKSDKKYMLLLYKCLSEPKAPPQLKRYYFTCLLEQKRSFSR
jgi:hypothetical protein